MPKHPRQGRVVAVLGPTNTGKTHLAMERMLGHDSGMIGFPLRLLARENYDRAVAAKGADQVALITGEEKIVPPGARYFLCTAEAMPLDRQVSFVALDEVQMCADPDRGHVFTDRLLNLSGTAETMFLGAETMRPVLRDLAPDAEYIVRPRFSTLSYTGARKITRLPRRSAIVTFSVADVHAIAELVRRQRGGAAVVLGALSPRTRNAQVAMFQSGEVDYLIATDAIGMGLNMDVDHVAFAGLRKFDGRAARFLSAAEMAQIAGRAGRHMNDGTFGTTAEVGPLDDEMVARIESHTFDPLAAVSWRNADLRFESINALCRSLSRPPDGPRLIRAREADDERALRDLAQDPVVAGMARGPDAVELLWEVCRIPDFRKIMSDAHARLLGRIYRYLMEGDRRLPTDWMAAQVTRVDRVDGDIDTLMQRIAAIRIWTYVAHHGDWLEDPGHWQIRTREVEDRLSDALHHLLTQRFVDRRTAALIGRLRDRDCLSAEVEDDGAVLVAGHPVGRLEGFRFHPIGDGPSRTQASRAVDNAARNALRGELTRRLRRLEDAGDDAFRLDNAGRIEWAGAPVARLVPGPDILRPAVKPIAGDGVQGDDRERLRRRLAAWLEGHLRQRLEPLFTASAAPLAGSARGLVFELCEALGSMPRARVAGQVGGLDREARKALRDLGIRIGRESIFIPVLLKPAAVAVRRQLWSARHQADGPAPLPGRVSVPNDPAAPRGYLEAIGYRPLGPLAVRVDIVERLAGRCWSLSRAGPFALDPTILNLLGCSADNAEGVLAAIGFKATGDGSERRFAPAPQKARKRTGRAAKAGRRRPVDPDSPFAKLGDLALAR